jgi:hypothetical protein
LTQIQTKLKQANPRNTSRCVSFSLDTVAQTNISDVSVKVFKQYLTKQLRASQRLIDRLKEKKKLIIKLRKFGFEGEADKLKKCCSNFKALVCENGHSFRAIVDFRCHLPICADCWQTKAHRELSNKLPKFHQALKDNPSLIVAFNTLTLRSDKDTTERDLQSGCREIKTSFRKLRKRDIWENCVGGFGRIENTFSKKFGWHPHLHSILLLKNYIPQKSLSDAWHSITKDSMIVDIRAVKDIASGLVECIKYPFKPSDILKLGFSELKEMLNLKGERLGLSFGCLFGIETDADIDDEIKSDYSDFCGETKTLEIGDFCPICQTRLDLIDFSAKGYASFLPCVRITPQRE